MRTTLRGLYVHIPFCVRKCPYCDFNTFDLERNAVRRFLEALRKELTLWKAQLDPPAFDTLFIGGGTPTVLSGTQLADLIGWVHETLELKANAEITVEANPGSVTVAGLRAMVAAGVTRVSMGVQSFSDEMLQRIGRNHTVRDVFASYDLIRAAGIDNVNFDLMYALPGQTRSDWEHTLRSALKLSPEHLSCYSLIIEEGTPFASLHKAGQLHLPVEEDEAWMYEFTVEQCTAAGYEHYEISNFARPGYRCRHNEIYWRNEQWLGVGPGAHSFWGDRRFWNVRGLDEYVGLVSGGKLPEGGYESLSLQDQMEDTLMMGLRLTQGVRLTDFAKRFGSELMAVYGETVRRLEAWGMVEVNAQHLRLTPRGRLLGNRVIAEFLR